MAINLMHMMQVLAISSKFSRRVNVEDKYAGQSHEPHFAALKKYKVIALCILNFSLSLSLSISLSRNAHLGTRKSKGRYGIDFNSSTVVLSFDIHTISFSASFTH